MLENNVCFEMHCSCHGSCHGCEIWVKWSLC